MTQLDPQIQAVLEAMAAQPQPATPPTLDEVRAGAGAGSSRAVPAVRRDGERRDRGHPRTERRRPLPGEHAAPVRHATARAHLLPRRWADAAGRRRLPAGLHRAGRRRRLHRRQRRLPAHAGAPVPPAARRRLRRLPVVPRARRRHRWRPVEDRGRRRQRGRVPGGGDLPRREAARRAPARPPVAGLSGHRRDEPLREHDDHRRVHRRRPDHRAARRALRRSAAGPAGLTDPRRRSLRPGAGVHPPRRARPLRRPGPGVRGRAAGGGRARDALVLRGHHPRLLHDGRRGRRRERGRRRGRDRTWRAPSPASCWRTRSGRRLRRRPGRGAPTACSRPRRPAPRRRPATSRGPR